MAALRRNVLADPAVRDAYVTGVQSLKSEFLGPTTSDFGIPGTVEQVSTYDLFTVWHHLAMGRMTPPTQNDRNAAHSGPVFLPWHRLMLLLFELQIQRVLNDATIGLPYWDWAADGALPHPARRDRHSGRTAVSAAPGGQSATDHSRPMCSESGLNPTPSLRSGPPIEA